MLHHYPESHRRGLVFWRATPLFCLLFALSAPAAWAGEEAPGSTSSPKPTPAPTLAQKANDVLMRAISLVGTPYVWGGNTPESGFDCSGLVNYVYRDMLNLRLPRTSRELATLPAAVGLPQQLATGDLVFFATDGQVTHVGIYVGDGRFVHAPRTGGTVRLERLDGAYWQARYAGARRVLASIL